MSRLKWNHKENRKSESGIRHIGKKVLLLAMVLCISAGGLTNIASSSEIVTPPPSTSVHVSLNFVEETAMVTPGSLGSTKFYFSKDKKSWELIEPVNTIDISTFLATKAVNLYFKGNKDTEPLLVPLPAPDTTLTTAYGVVGGEGRITFTGTALPVEYRKGTYGQWRIVPGPLVTTQYEMTGTTLYFRITATATTRSGKIISVKVPKKPSAPSVKVDGSKLYISGLKVGETEYRIGDSLAWIPFSNADTRIKYIDLKYLFGNTLPSNTQIPAGTVEFRTAPSDSKVASVVKVIEVPLQPAAPATVTINGTTLTVQDSNLKRYYEYTVVTGVSAFNVKTAGWTSFTSAKPVIVKKAVLTNVILVRIKATTDPATKQIIPASVYREFVVSAVTPY